MTVSTHTSFAATSSAATATITVVDGDLATTNQFTEGTYVSIESHDGTKRIYVLSDASESGASATGVVLTSASDTGASTLGAATAALGTCVAVNANLNTATQAAVLNALKAAIVHANGHNGKITAGADLVAADGNQSIIFTQATAGENGDTAIISNIDTALMTTTDFSGGHAEGDKKDKHTILNGGNISSAKGNSKSLVAIVGGQKVSGSQVIANDASSMVNQVGITTVESTGKLAYNPNSPDITRSSTDTGFVMRGGVPTLIASVATSTIDFHARGSDNTARHDGGTGSIHVPDGIHKYSRKGTWATTIFNAYRNPTKALADDDKRIGLLQSDGTNKSGITGRGSDASLATDNAATPTRAIPGEMTLLFNHVTFTTNNLDYSAITG